MGIGEGFQPLAGGVLHVVDRKACIRFAERGLADLVESKGYGGGEEVPERAGGGGVKGVVIGHSVWVFFRSSWDCGSRFFAGAGKTRGDFPSRRIGCCWRFVRIGACEV